MPKSNYSLIGLLCLVLLTGFTDGRDLSPRENVRRVYSREIGTREETGRNDGKDVEKYLRYVGLGKGYAWCAAFVSWSLGEAGIKNPKSAWSPAMFPAGSVVWKRTWKVSGTPSTGDVFGIYFASLKRIAHVGFIDTWGEGDYAITVEGNTNDAGSREGDGVYRKRRLKRQIYAVSSFIR